MFRLKIALIIVHRIKDQELEINQLKAENELLRKQTARLPSGVPQLPAKGMNVRAVSGTRICSTIRFF